MILGLKLALLKNEYDMTEDEKLAVRKVAEIWAVILPTMWT